MTGRSDLLSGCASAIWDNDPADAEALLVKQQIAMRNSPNVRNAAIAASSKQALREVAVGNLPDRATAYVPIGTGAKIAGRGKWIGEYRAIAHSPGSLMVELGRHLHKWP